jgi:hypothetical protein
MRDLRTQMLKSYRFHILCPEYQLFSQGEDYDGSGVSSSPSHSHVLAGGHPRVQTYPTFNYPALSSRNQRFDKGSDVIPHTGMIGLGK